jgi:ATP-dependent helicase/nuclease subunit A
LVAPVCGDQLIEGWLSVLDPVHPQSRDRAISSPAPGCPTFGTDSVLDRGPKGAVPLGGPVSPGLHHPIPGGAPVVWWDPRRLLLSVEEPLPLRHQQILEASSEAATASETAYTTWMERGEALRSRATQPSLTVKTVTALARRAGAAPESSRADGKVVYPGVHPPRSPVRVETVARKAETRPGGRRFGALVHAVLASIDLDAVLAAIRATSAVQARIIGASAEETEAAVATVSTALQHPILRRAAACTERGTIRRETPVLLALEDGALVEGVVDFAFRDRDGDFDGWTVVDFKTDQEYAASSAQYVEQVMLYSSAIEVATAMPARGILLLL